MLKQYDLIVVGGGLGGSTLAKCMAEHGAQVLVLERERQFKDRVRGEFMAPWGVAEARKLGIDRLLCEQVAHEIPWVDFFSGSVLTAHRDVVATTPHQLPCVAFYHPAMQELLIEAAAGAGARVRRGVAVMEIRTGAPATVVLGDGGRTEEIRARLVVGADGRSSIVRASARFQVRRDPDDMLVAGMLLEDVSAPEDIAQLVINSSLGQIAALFPQGGGRARSYLCYHMGTKSRYQGSADVLRYIDDCKATGMNPLYYERVKQAGPLATFDGAEAWVDHPYRDEVALVGDAAASSDPTWGQGLAQTLRDVRVLRDHLQATVNWDAAGHAYAEEHDRYSSLTHLGNQWFTEFYLETGAEADVRRARALPLIADDPSRQPDILFSGPDVPLTEAEKRRFFAEPPEGT